MLEEYDGDTAIAMYLEALDIFEEVCVCMYVCMYVCMHATSSNRGAITAPQ